MFGFAKKLVKQAEGIIAPEIQSSTPTYGFRVLHVEPDSEAFHAKIEPFFDYIIAANGVKFQTQYYGNQEKRSTIAVEQEQSPADEFEEVIKSTEERLVLEIWCAKGKATRVVTLPNPNKLLPSGVGISVRWSQLGVADHVWHVLNVVRESPADCSGLISHADYIIAAENGLLDCGGEGLLGKVVSNASPSDGILFYVYNRDYDVVRPVRVHPSFDGKLGCGVGYGFLHALPAVSTSGRGTSAPGATLFDDRDTQREPLRDPAMQTIMNEPLQFLDTSVQVPMPTIDSTTVPPPKAPVPRVNTHHSSAHNKSAHATDLSDYFNEQSQISKEIDGTSKAGTNSAPLPPPPPSVSNK